MPDTEPKLQSDSAILGIFAGLGIGVVTWIGSALLIVILLNGTGHARHYINLLLAIPYLVPPAAVAYFGIVARRDKRPKFAAGFFVAAALVFLLEATCAYLWFS